MLDLTTIRGAARARGIKFGSAVSQYNLADTAYMNFLAANCDILVAENEMKMATLQPSQGVFDFGPADAIAAFAATNGISLRFHALVWHRGMPAWGPAAIASNWTSVLDTHIQAVASRYPVTSCDVANEVIAQDGLGLRTDSPWYQASGDAYIYRAFEKAAEHLPRGCKKLLCDYEVESGANPQAKADTLVSLVESLKSEGTIDGVGIQGHLLFNKNGSRLDTGVLSSILVELKSLGMVVNLTEIDAANNNGSYDQASFKKLSAIDIGSMVRTWVDADVGNELLVWGSREDISWLHGGYPSWTQWPAIVSASYQKNPLYYRMLESLVGGIN